MRAAWQPKAVLGERIIPRVPFEPRWSGERRSLVEESALGGGAVNEVVRVGTTVRRTPTARSGYVRDLLALFERSGWAGAPRFLGTDERGRDTFTHIEGRAALTAGERAVPRCG
jgi:monomeric isocitrate dehydrogenase